MVIIYGLLTGRLQGPHLLTIDRRFTWSLLLVIDWTLRYMSWYLLTIVQTLDTDKVPMY